MTDREALVGAALVAVVGATADRKFRREVVTQADDIRVALPIIVAAVTDEVRAWLEVGEAMRHRPGLPADYAGGADGLTEALRAALGALDRQMGVER